jgi:hypothetical protein
MQNSLMIIKILVVFIFSISTAFAKPYSRDLDARLVTKTNKKLEKMLPVLEKQVELLIKMIGNEKYRDKLETEFAKVIATYDTYGRHTPQNCNSRCQGLRTKENENEWTSGQKLSFLGTVLKKYKVPLSKTCIGVKRKDYPHQDYKTQSVYQPLNWNFPLYFLGGEMFATLPLFSIGFGQVDLRSLDESELIRMANISNKIVELQTVLREGIEDQFDEDALQQVMSFEGSGKKYFGAGLVFGTQTGRQPLDKDPCDLFKGKGQAKFYWPVIGYEMILPKEIVTSAHGIYFHNDYSFGGGALAPDLAKFPSEYINAWKNLAIYYADYFYDGNLPGARFALDIDMYDKMLADKTEEPLDDLMSEDSNNDGENLMSDDDDLALPSLD